MVKKVLVSCLVAGGLLLAAAPAGAADHEVRMRNMGAGGMMVFEPAMTRIEPGDTVHFVAADKGHNVESIAGMIPDGAQPFAGKLNEDLTVTFDKPGVYGFKCRPHYPMGMVGLIVVGKPVNEDAAKAVDQPPKPKQNFAKLFGQLDSTAAAAN